MTAPPRLADALLRWLLPEEIGEALRGDLEEAFRRRAGRDGGTRARLWYWGQVLRLPYGALAGGVRRLRRSRWRSVRSMTAGGWTMGRFGEELRIGVRSLRHRPGFSLVVIATLAASIGAATLVFSALEAVLVRTLPYRDADRIVSLYTLNPVWRESDNPALREFWNHYPVALDELEAARSVPGVVAAGAAGTGDVVVRMADGARQIPSAMVSDGLFETLGVAPQMGRLPSPEELQTGAPVVVVSHAFWTDELGRDPGAVGRTLGVDGRPLTVIGVMPRGFFFPSPGQELWTTMPESLLRDGRSAPVSTAVARLSDAASVEDVSAALDARARQLLESDPARSGMGMRAVLRRDEVIGEVGKGFALFMGAVALVVLLASVNLANLVLARASRRRGELAVRRALGGGRTSVAWTVLSEVLLLGAVGGILGVVAAAVLLGPFASTLASVDMLQGMDVHLNLTVLAFAAGTTLLAALGAGVPVAWRAARSYPAAALRDGPRGGSSRGARRTQRLLLVAESGLAFVLLAGAALMLRSVAALSSVDTGYEPAGLHFVEVSLAEDRGGEDAAARVRLFQRVADRVAARTGSTATLVDPLPSAGSSPVEAFRATGTETPADVPTSRVGADFFQVAGLPLLRGRGFRASDGPDAPAVVVLGESLARRIASGGDPLGMQVVVGTGEEERQATVVGVAADARMLAIPLGAQAHLYLPFAQFPAETANILVRGGEDVAPGLREAVLAVDPDLVVVRLGTVGRVAWQLLAPVRVRATLLAALSALALLLAGVGVAGVVAHVMEERTREIGIRIALGALPRGETRRVTRSFLLTVAIGTGLGLGVALAASRLLGSFLYEVEPLDPLSYGVAALLLPALGALAAWVPARRAARVDPVEVLRGE